MRDEFVNALFELAKNDSNIFLITGDLGYGVLDKFCDAYPKQFLNVGVSEQSMIGVAAGLASEGHKVFVYSIANFPTLRCLEQIRNDLCYHNFPVTIVSVGAGLSYSKLGYTHHGIEDIGVMRSLPNLNIFSPGSVLELKKVLEDIYLTTNPSYLRLGHSSTWSDVTFPLQVEGSLAYQLTGTDALIVTTSSMLEEGQLLRARLKEAGRNVSLASAFRLKPFIADLNFIRRFKIIVTVEEHSINGGLGSILNDFVMRNELPNKVINFGILEEIASTFGDINHMREAYRIDSLNLFTRLKNFI